MSNYGKIIPHTCPVCGHLNDDATCANQPGAEQTISHMRAAKKTSEPPKHTARPSLCAAPGSAPAHATESVFKGETWLAYRPGEDHNHTFRAQWVSRTRQGALCSVLNSRQDLIKNAKLCKVRLKWQNTELRHGAKTPDV